ncbi:MAG: hypothetical protein K0S14_2288 [Thermomicrobiales bacterium]|jgi:hypothetical protein|nr:hypothetical protein [Thermomicrobiales bacterium]MCD6056856.1 hypothetical protein [Thermomicrobiales bacterium]MDF2757758.1 hypothetical protein [Thermomicrobiales bacterium]MDF3015179.1 hypothetical protein [Thermomicrobiales bacterium]
MTRPNPEQRERLAYVTLVGLFLGMLGVFVSRERKERHVFDPHPRDILLIALATFRAGRVTAFERVTEPFRDPVTETVPDAFEAGEYVIAEGTGVRKAIGELVSCPICVGTWVASGLVYGLRIAPGPTRLVAAILGVSGLAEMLNAVTETLSWGAQAARKQAGS